ncbi:MAG TPA: 3-oxoacyl-ACP reductase FabG [Deltaproteobacteria bacterium]|nr:3-oxoacyl-ACP reductase FabG [Deltaproteobacteria bacterium]
MNRRFGGRTALVTGASRGIGRAIALRLAAEGAKVAVCYRSDEAAALRVLDEVRGLGAEGIAVRLSVRERPVIREALAATVSALGEIDVLVNNAGVNRPEDFDRISDEDWDEVVGTNLTGAFKVTQEALPKMRDGAAVVNISSVSGQYGGPRTTHYCVSKAGLIALTQNLAIFCAPRGIRVNAVAPGLIATEMASAAKGLGVEEKILLRRMGTTGEVAAAVAFLASDDASYITGHTLNVNGGLHLG